MIDNFAEADELVYVIAPINFGAVGIYYEEFSPTSDRRVLELLDEADVRIKVTGPRDG